GRRIPQCRADDATRQHTRAWRGASDPVGSADRKHHVHARERRCAARARGRAGREGRLAAPRAVLLRPLLTAGNLYRAASVYIAVRHSMAKDEASMTSRRVEAFLPLTPPMLHTLVALADGDK